MKVKLFRWKLEISKWTEGYYCPRTGNYFPSKKYHNSNCWRCQPYTALCGHTISPDEKRYLWHGKCDACQTAEERQEREKEIAEFLAK